MVKKSPEQKGKKKMTIDIKFAFDNGSCWCGSTRCHLLIRDGEIIVDECSGNYEWQRGKASAPREYGQYFRGAERLKRWSKSGFFNHLSEEIIKGYVLALVFLGETGGRKSPSFWRLCNGNGRLADGYSHAVSIMR